MDIAIYITLAVTVLNTLAIMGTCTHQIIVHHLRKSNKNSVILTNNIQDSEDIELGGISHKKRNYQTTLTINNDKKEDKIDSSKLTKVGKAALDPLKTTVTKRKNVQIAPPQTDDYEDLAGASGTSIPQPLSRNPELDVSAENLRANARTAATACDAIVQIIEANARNQLSPTVPIKISPRAQEHAASTVKSIKRTNDKGKQKSITSGVGLDGDEENNNTSISIPLNRPVLQKATPITVSHQDLATFQQILNILQKISPNANTIGASEDENVSTLGNNGSKDEDLV